MSKDVLGHIDCPTCGTAKGMRITHDKNGEPFGYCEAECNQQMRIGGDKRRVKAFLARFPWAAGKTEPVTVTVSETVQKPEPVKAEKPEPVKAPAKTRSPFEDALKALGVA
jgi:hypothetical protein